MLDLIIYTWTLFWVLLPGCSEPSSGTKKLSEYNLSRPDERYVLPDTLREVSGLTVLDSNTVALVQDENGILFIYDLAEKKIKRQYQFHIDGDYEGITRVGKTIYILRSDGTLFEITDYQSDNSILKSYITGIPANNNEGLCYDSENNRLLIACKGKIGKGPGYKDQRVIYGFDLKTKSLTAEPVFDFDLQYIKKIANDRSIQLKTRTRIKKNQTVTEPVIKFMTSAIGIHPANGNLYLLSASDHLLFIFSIDGELVHLELLDQEVFNKAEGITFFANSDMLITNEGQHKKPTLLRFNYRQQ